jgi:hypothetical protein
VFTKDSNWVLSWAKQTQSTFSYLVCVSPIFGLQKEGGLCDHLAVCICVPLKKREEWSQKRRPLLSKPLRKHFPAAMNTLVTTEQLLDAVFYAQSVLYRILNIVAYRPVARQGPRNKQWDSGRCFVTVCTHVNNIRAIAKQQPITTIEELLKAAFSVGSAPRPYNEDPRPAEGDWEFSYGIFAGQQRLQRGKLKNLYC